MRLCPPSQRTVGGCLGEVEHGPCRGPSEPGGLPVALMDLSQVVAPDLFDAIAEPDVLLPLVMANAMSPRLWRLGRKVGGAADPLEAARRVVDTSFTHATAERVAQLSGVIDLDAERRRLGPAVVDLAIAEIDHGWDIRRSRGLLPAGDDLQEHMAAGRFPAYTYANVDVINAARRAIGGPAQRPRGLTSCLDEAALFAALVMTAPSVTGVLDGITLLASSLHYTVFGWTGEDAWWFWSKRDLYSRDSFRQRVIDHHGGDPADAVMTVMAAPFRRLISRRGHVDFVSGVSSLPPEEVQRTLVAIDGFFGHRPHGFDGQRDELRFVEPSPHDVLFDEAVRCASAAEVQQVIRNHRAAAGPTAAAAIEALLAFRSLEVDDLMPYLLAARRGPLVTERAAGIRSVQEALAVAAAPADGPALGDSSRLALPDEVLGRGSCSPAERGLLLHVLLEHLGQGPVRTEIVGGDALTRIPSMVVRASDSVRLDAGAVRAEGPAFAHSVTANQQ